MPGPHDRVVVAQQEADHGASSGMRTETAVPSPGADSISIDPPWRSARCRIARRPNAIPSTSSRCAACRIEPDPVVDHVERDLVAEVAERQLGPWRVGVAQHVRERALGDAQQRRVDRHRQHHGVAAGAERDPGRRPGLLRLLVDRIGEPPQRGGQGLLVERRGSELADEPARLAEVLGGRLAREPQLLAGALVVDVALGGVQQHLDAREPLRHRVVDLACEALALGERAGLAARGGELLARGEQVEDEGLPVAASPATWPGSRAR